MVLGAAVGFGFSAFETLGISFSTILTDGRTSVANVLQNMLLRDLLAPFQHGLWTALVGGALFISASQTSRLRLTPRVLGWFGVAALMHLVWDFAPNVGSLVSALVDGIAVDWPAFNDPWVPTAPMGEKLVRTSMTTAIILADCALGATLARRMWKRVGRASTSAATE